MLGKAYLFEPNWGARSRTMAGIYNNKIERNRAVLTPGAQRYISVREPFAPAEIRSTCLRHFLRQRQVF